MKSLLKLCMQVVLLQLFILSPLLIKGQSFRDQYQANAPFHVLYDMQELAKEKKLYYIHQLMPEIALMVRYRVDPYPELNYYSKKNNRFMSCRLYRTELEETLATMPATERIEALVNLNAYGEKGIYTPLIDSLLIEQKKRKTYLFYQGLEDWATAMAAVGRTASAELFLNLIGDNRRTDRAYMHLAVKKAANGQIDSAMIFANRSLDIASDVFLTFETIRQFFLLMDLLGQNNAEGKARMLIQRFPGPTHQVVARAFLAKGAKDEMALKNTI
ncbi:MAG: hypothetical protein SFV22_09580, partial [Saprospiraceae bacterium]|nr:hypothetical protein [Saprospiraceae bacterium]